MSRIILRVALGLVAAIVLVAVLLYVLACWMPSDYRPARLSAEQRRDAKSDFYRHMLRFQNAGQDVEPFTWSLDEGRLNRYLAAMDEIAFQGGGKRGQVDRAMREAGLAEPAVALDDGGVTLMARSTDYNKVLSVRLRFEFTPERKLRAVLDGVWVGRAPVPQVFVDEQIQRLKRLLADYLAGSGRDRSRQNGLGTMLGRAIAAIDGEAIDPVVSWRVSAQKRVRIERIDIADGRLTLHAVPIHHNGGD